MTLLIFDALCNEVQKVKDAVKPSKRGSVLFLVPLSRLNVFNVTLFA